MFNCSNGFLKSALLSSSVLLCACSDGSGSREQGRKGEQMEFADELVRFAKGFEFISTHRGFNSSGLLMRSVESGEMLSLWFKSPEDSAGAAALCPRCPVVVLDGEDGFGGIATWSTTHVALLAKAGGLKTWVATGYRNQVQAAVERVEASAGSSIAGSSPAYDTNGVADLGGAGGVDREVLLSCGAGVLTSYPFGNPMEGLTDQTGVPVLPLQEYLEPHPLGRAEYILLMGWLAGTGHTARTAFAEIEAAYRGLCEEGRQLAHIARPVVFSGSVDAGVWHAPGPNSFAAQLIRDAGATYLLDGVEVAKGKSGNVQVDLEQMLMLSSEADFWGKVVHAPSGWTRADAQQELPWLDFDRIGSFHCNTAQADYFTQAVVEPHLMLADLLYIFHPSIRADANSTPFQPAYFQSTRNSSRP